MPIQEEAENGGNVPARDRQKDLKDSFEQFNAKIDDLKRRNEQDFDEYRAKVTAAIAQGANQLDGGGSQEEADGADPGPAGVSNLAFFPQENGGNDERNENLTSQGDHDVEV